MVDDISTHQDILRRFDFVMDRRSFTEGMQDTDNHAHKILFSSFVIILILNEQ